MAKKFIASRVMKFVAFAEDGGLDVITLQPGDAVIVQPEAFNVENAPSEADMIAQPDVEMPVALPSSAKRRALTSSAPRPSSKIRDFRSSAFRGSVLRNRK